ncbi:FAD-binding domain-containing protein [Brumimicrobium oceani]|uniref:FAD-binding domain-containing protein n=1 Tax=Brumimicrobium oceani TaxID=2100725 RepID=UPI001E332523|nr:FAD-binding domain-containing protein [Brumimicrobium oceani]
MKYASTRNFENGAVTYLSPYISRGVISTQQVMNYVQSLDLPWYKTEKFVQELAWRDYWQQVHIDKKEAILTDLKNEQSDVTNHEIPSAIVAADTGIIAVDEAIEKLYETGYMHNHMRMYVAAICCNIAKSHWLVPAKWLYAHLKDGDLASNHLSWQWTAGAFSNKKYVANQENINKYFDSDQTGTFLDIPYSAFEHLKIPKILLRTEKPGFNLCFPETSKAGIKSDQKTLIYNYYNIDPNWHSEEKAQRIFLIEPSFFQKYPVSQKSLDFALELTENIEEIQIYVGEFSELNKEISSDNIIFKEHPTNNHYVGKSEDRDWMSDVKGYHSSFFKFWKKVQKEIKW